jgi:acyl dehydratase
VNDGLVTGAMRACIGTSMPAIRAPEEIGATEVRRYLEVVGDTNPLYRDDAFARELGYAGRVVPPMLILQVLWRLLASDGSISDWPGLTFPPAYKNSRNASQEVTWLRPAYICDRIEVQHVLKDIYVRQGRAGVPVIYVVRETQIRNQHGETLARQLATVAKLPEAAVKNP